MFPVIPYHFNLYLKRLKGTLSKALEKSRTRLSKDSYHSLHVYVQYNQRNSEIFMKVIQRANSSMTNYTLMRYSYHIPLHFCSNDDVLVHTRIKHFTWKIVLLHKHCTYFIKLSTGSALIQVLNFSFLKFL